GVENTERALRSTLELAHPTKRIFRHHGQTMSVDLPDDDEILWIPPILKTVSTEGTGIAELAEAIEKHAEHLRQSGDWDSRDRTRLRSELEAMLMDELMNRFLGGIQQTAYDEILNKVIQRDISPYDAVRILLDGKM
ncbi:MAG TPA: hypothetical protein VK851_09285, partial [Anaerolineales bacterium]|nr:hypothetical protein [Anaerolineales bacterium]